MAYWHGGWGRGDAFMMLLMALFFWGSIVTIVVLLVRSNAGHHAHVEQRAHDTSDSAIRILDERFARGEIDPDEYRTRRDLLRTR